MHDLRLSPVTSLWQRILRLTGHQPVVGIIMFKKLAASILDLAKQPTWWMEVSVSGSLTAWAGFTIAAGYLNHYNFGMLLGIMQEKYWVNLALFTGILHSVALIFSGNKGLHWWNNSHNWRAVACLCSAWFFSMLIIDLVHIKPIPSGVAMYMVPLVLDLVAVFKNARRTA